MTDQPQPRTNPYIGPRAFRTGETLHGRDREVDELLDLLIAERIVLLYSPSGAGKTSLVQAALIPKLQADEFHVLPPMRVSAEPPNGLARDGQPPNRFILSALLSLEEGLPAEKQTPLDELAQTQLLDYLMRRLLLPDAQASEVLIFDQFEEILTVDPTNQADRLDFFAQVGQALRDKNRWALFSMREDFLAALDPYLRSLPTRLANRFRLDLLGEAAARTAMQAPARQAGVDFSPAAAQKLSGDLSLVRVQRADGTFEERPGPYIEPVQLQVVCYRLWEHVPDGATRIEESDVESVGDVDTVLAAYYADRVAAAAQATGVSERAIRDWFDQHLITEQGIRAQVLWGGEMTEGLDSRAIRPLIDAHLVRSEKRRGAIWFELSHDRLINPVRQNNAAWREANLTELQRRAAVWDKQNRPDGLLLRGGELTTGQSWAAVHADELTPIEQEFLAGSIKLREMAEREKRRNRLILRLFIGSVMTTIVAGILFVVALAANERAIRQTQLAQVRQLIAQSSDVLETQPQGSLLLALEALRAAQQTSALGSAEDALRRAFVNAGGIVLLGHSGRIFATAISLDNRWAVTVGERKAEGVNAILWDLAFPNPAALHTPLNGHDDDIQAVAFSPDSRWLATGSDDGTARLWDLQAAEGPNAASCQMPGRDTSKAIRAIAFSGDSRWLVTGGADGTPRLWDLGTPDPCASPIDLPGHTGSVLAVALSADNRWIATGSSDNAVRVWDVWAWSKPGSTAPRSAPTVLTGHTDSVTRLAFSPDSHWLASGSEDASVRLWDMTADPISLTHILPGNEEAVLSLAFSHTGDWLASGGFDQTVRLWNVTFPDPRLASIVLHGHTDQVSAIAFTSDDRWLISTGRDTTTRMWDITARDPEIASVVLRGHEEWIRSAAVSSDNRWLITGSEDGTARLRGITIPDSDAAPIILRGHASIARVVAFTPDGRWLATASGDGTVRLWDVASDDPASGPIALRGHTGSIFTMAISPDGHWLASGGQDTIVQLWDLTTISPGAQPITLTGHTKTVRALSFSNDKRWLVSAGRDTTIRLWNLAGGDGAPPNPAANPELLSGHTALIRVTAISSDSHWLISGGDGGQARLWDLTAPDPQATMRELPGHRDAIRAVAFSGDNHWVVTAGDDRVVRMWDLTAPDPAEALRELPGHEDVVTAAAFTPDNRFLITAGLDNSIWLWDIAGPRTVATVLLAHNDAIRAIAISRDQRWLLSGSEDNTARLWNLADSARLGSPILLPGHTQPVWGVAISPDGSRFATVSGDTTAGLWQYVPLEEIEALACQRVGRNLTFNEWIVAMGDAGYHRTCPDLPPGEGVP